MGQKVTLPNLRVGKDVQSHAPAIELEKQMMNPGEGVGGGGSRIAQYPPGPASVALRMGGSKSKSSGKENARKSTATILQAASFAHPTLRSCLSPAQGSNGGPLVQASCAMKAQPSDLVVARH